MFAAMGGHVPEGAAIEMLGAFVSAVVGTNGEVLSPAGLPNIVLFRACRPGNAIIDVLFPLPGMRYEERQGTVIEITIGR